nr:hypothetical protein CFP56_11094 [Quercus suber]
MAGEGSMCRTFLSEVMPPFAAHDDSSTDKRCTRMSTGTLRCWVVCPARVPATAPASCRVGSMVVLKRYSASLSVPIPGDDNAMGSDGTVHDIVFLEASGNSVIVERNELRGIYYGQVRQVKLAEFGLLSIGEAAPAHVVRNTRGRRHACLHRVHEEVNGDFRVICTGRSSLASIRTCKLSCSGTYFARVRPLPTRSVARDTTIPSTDTSRTTLGAR